jgi:serine protease Do
MRLHRWYACLLGCGCLLAIGWLFTGHGIRAQEKDQQVMTAALEGRVLPGMLAPAASRRTPIVNAVERARGATVNIHSQRTVHTPVDTFNHATTPNRVNGMGTGIIIDPRGYIVTNYHVVEDVNVIRVRLSDGTEQNAAVVARNPETDLALIRIDVGRPLPTITLGTASDLMVGETVLAIGNAYGYEHTVSVGIVSAVKRDVSLNKEMSYKSLIQTDACINPGNSGGPLLNIHGELVGVNVAIRAGAQGIGFAIPVDNMIRTVCELLKKSRRSSSYDGFTVRDRLETVGDSVVRKVQVERVEGDSPAAKAGLRAGDVVTHLGEVRVACSFDVDRALLDLKAGEHIKVAVRRDGKEQACDLTLAPRATPSTDLVWTKLGLHLASVDSESVSRVTPQLKGGLEVIGVNADSLAARAGIRKGDILVGLHDWETITLENVAYVLGHPDLASFNPLKFFIVRAGTVRQGTMRLPN